MYQQVRFVLLFQEKLSLKKFQFMVSQSELYHISHSSKQCHNCLLYGHRINQCRGKAKCIKCGKSHESDVTCSRYCIYCKSTEHSSNEFNCPEYNRQKEIKQLMSFWNISYFEANQQIPKNRENPIPNINDLPALPNRGAHQNGIPVSKRRSEALSNTRLPTYSQKIRTPKRRRSHDEYDKKKHQECLISPSIGKIIQSPKSTLIVALSA
ncbi:unnamed protein product [Psylliodes chrysocephalus]|uniref:Uncharacterized protein n=1 Tax=Psylliodes chrysocephalus TaxID=3402493 RepID=A0A9P0GFN0_9CUCU|nr:unnamed protein product [Psylliodes chrysocephala]